MYDPWKVVLVPCLLPFLPRVIFNLEIFPIESVVVEGRRYLTLHTPL
jgi:hypothetical protein